MNISQMTENELRDEERQLTQRIESGEATISHAERLAETRQTLKRIGSVKLNRPWI